MDLRLTKARIAQLNASPSNSSAIFTTGAQIPPAGGFAGNPVVRRVRGRSPREPGALSADVRIGESRHGW
jgi:hypothetical protein